MQLIRKPAKNTASIEKLQREREHLETLFADRINFYLVFAAGVLVFLFDKDHPPAILKPALIAVVILSLLMLMTFTRTYLLVKFALDDIVEHHSGEPYARYFAALDYWFLPNANKTLLGLPITLTVFFCYALWRVYHP
jgi:hypothetical protein